MDAQDTKVDEEPVNMVVDSVLPEEKSVVSEGVQEDESSTDAIALSAKSSSSSRAASSDSVLAPPRRPPTAYFLYAQDMRQSGLLPKERGVGIQSQHIGKGWKELLDVKKEEYNKRAEVLRRQYEKDLAAFKVAHPDYKKLSGALESLLVLPWSRVSKLVLADNDVSKASKEAKLVITKSTELFVEWFAQKSYAWIATQKRKTLTMNDFHRVKQDNQELEFLQAVWPEQVPSDFPMKPLTSLERESLSSSSKESSVNSITSYFQPASN
eukprot:50349_1